MNTHPLLLSSTDVEKKYIFLAISITINLSFLFGLAFAWPTLEELADIKKDIASFNSAEMRLSRQIIGFNDQLHDRLEQYQSTAQLNSVALAGLKRNVEDLTTQIEKFSEQFDPGTRSSVNIKRMAVPLHIPVIANSKTKKARKKTGTKKLSSPGPRYERVKSPDGKTVYRRIE